MRTKQIYFLLLIIWVSVSIIAASCSTDKNRWINRTYHNTTAHYNGYFNAGEIIKETMGEFKSGHKENYTEILPVFIYPNDEESKNFYAPMDTAVSKCETVIARNAMPNQKVGQYRNQEWCKWIDDNWYVIGKAQFLKRDFEGALEKFNYIAKQYKKEPISYTAKLWKAKTFIEEGRYDEAEEILEKLEETEELLKEQAEEAKKKKKEAKEKAKKYASKSKHKKHKKKSKSKKGEEDDEFPPLPKKFEQELFPVFADLYLRQKNYEKAEEYLRKSIEVTKNRAFKTRLMFILAQILQKQGSPEASDLYAEVVKRNPIYDMAFQAKINRALAYSGGDSRSIKAQLLKMLKDDKNIDYHDQIYYALGDIELREGNRPKGIEYLENSLLASKANKAQKSKTFLRLAKLYYEERNYVKAQQYYDSTVSVLPKEHKNYKEIVEVNKSLTDLVEHLNKIKEGDSLTQLCSMSEKEVLAKIDEIIEQKKQAIEAEKERQEMLLAQQMSSLPNGKPQNSGKFWAYDENLKKIGYQEFKTIWGDRPLEDNWRRSDKGVSEVVDEGEEGEEENKELTPDFYLKSLPCNDKGKMDKLVEDVKMSLYESGVIYKTKLKDNEQAKKSFEELVKRFLPDEIAVAGLYQLYLLTNGEEKEKYKQKILNEYPNSEYAKIIKDPNYKQKEELALNKAENEYRKAYQLYSSGAFDEAINASEKAIAKEGNSGLLCKYYYLKAVSSARKYAGTKDLSPVEKALTDVTKHCKGNEVYEPAKRLLDKLRNVQSVSNAIEGKNTYIYDAESPHFFILVFPSGKGSINKAKAKISDFNSASFSKKNLSTSSSFVDQKTQVVVVKWFKNKEEAMDYYTAFKVNKNQLPPLNEDFDFFVIAEKNFATLYIEKDIQKYKEFFEKNYLE